jgi:hypothetical protein
VASSLRRAKCNRMKTLPQKMGLLAIGVGLLLLVPWVAMRFTDEVAWSVADFAAAAGLLFCAGSACVAITHGAPQRRLLVAVTVLVVLAAVWAEFAVGVFGTPWAGS